MHPVPPFCKGIQIRSYSQISKGSAGAYAILLIARGRFAREAIRRPRAVSSAGRAPDF